MQEKARAEKILHLLKQNYPSAKIILNFSNEWELLVAVMLSAQCTDIMVNKVTSKLFPKFRNLKLKMKNEKLQFKIKNIDDDIQEIINYAEVPLFELEQDIRSTGFYKNKAKNLQAAAKMVLEKYGGKVPKTIAEMVVIPGVARKTANVVLGNAYKVFEGIAVDTHVRRVSGRLGLTKNINPDKIEQDLMKLFDSKDWFPLTYLLIEHGRKICEAKKPKCDECFLNQHCPSAFNFPHFKKK